MSLRVAFLGSPAFAVPSLVALAGRGTVALVVTQPDRPAGRGRKLEPTAVRGAAASLGLEVAVWEPGGRTALESRLRALDLDALVVVAFGRILKPSTLATARTGAVNVHASLLPRWRGVAPIERAILAGDAATGVTLMVLDAGIDTGPVLAAQRLPITAADTRVTLAATLAEAGARLLSESLADWVHGRLIAVPQPPTGATYAPRLEKSEGRMDWQRDATSLWNQVRGLAEWPGAFTTLAAGPLKVHVVRPHPETAADTPPGTIVSAAAATGVRVACGRGTLELVVVQQAGKPRVAGLDLARGRVLQVGSRLGT